MSVSRGSASNQPPEARTDQRARWTVRLLGDVHLESANGTTLERLPSRAAAVLLARLVTAPGRAHPREELIDMLWPDASLDVGRNRLRQVLSTLKSLLEAPGANGVDHGHGPVILADRQTLRVAPHAFACDVVTFEARMRARDHVGARACYGGPLMPGFVDEWVLDERQRLEALVDRIDPEADGGPPSDERTHDHMRDDTHDRTHDHPLDHVPDRSRDRSPDNDAARATAATLTSLPNYLTRLHGVAGMLEQVARSLEASRLVTIVGPGGVGKTRLGAEAARRLAQEGWFDSVVFVSLIGAQTLEAAVDAVAAALRLERGRGEEGDRGWLIQALAGRRALLVLDNAEQIAGALGGEVSVWLDRLPRLHVLVTSRHALGVDGEHLAAMAALPVPEPRAAAAAIAASPAVSLFVDRARAARADFHLGARNTEAVAEIVRRLDGMPLAIELAAARVRSFAPPQLLALMTQHGDATLALVVRPGARGGRDARHASMADVIAWSWHLASDAARTLLGDTSVFVGGFTLEAAAAVAGMTLAEAAEAMAELVDHSLTRVVADGERHAHYELIREYAAARIAPERLAQARSRLRAWLAAWADSMPATPSLDEVRAGVPNLVAAFAGAVDDGAFVDAVELLARMRRCFDDVPLPVAGLRHLLAAADGCGADADGARGHALLAGLFFRAGQRTQAQRCADRALEVMRALTSEHGADAVAPGLQARVLHAVASVRWRTTRDGTRALALIDEAQPLAQRSGEVDVQASLCALRAFVVGVAHRDDVLAEALHRQATALWQALGNQHAVNSGLYNQAVIASRSGRAAQALERIDEILASATRLGDEHRIGQALNTQGVAYMALRRWGDAARALGSCARHAWRHLDMHNLAIGLWNLARVLTHLRRPDAAARVMGFASAFWAANFGELGDQDRRDVLAVRRLAGLTLSPTRLDAAWREGAVMTPAQVVALALDVIDERALSEAAKPAH